jgi:hypothetical protein
MRSVEGRGEPSGLLVMKEGCGGIRSARLVLAALDFWRAPEGIVVAGLRSRLLLLAVLEPSTRQQHESGAVGLVTMASIASLLYGMYGKAKD